MELIYWWLALVAAVLLAGVAFYAWRRLSKKATTSTHSLPVASTWRLQRLPAYRQALRRYQLLVRGLFIVMGIAVAACLLLVGRLASVTVATPDAKNRDIILCLDVSGSMTKTDAAITKLYAEAAKGFTNERIGMVVFDSSPIVLFPLTNDYSFVSERLATIATAFEKSNTADFNDPVMRDYYDMLAGTNEANGSSLIGDGLASCVNRFDRLDSKRSRSIIFGTDNYLAGEPIVTLQEAAQLAKEKDVRVYGINPGDYSYGQYETQEAKDFKAAMLLTNGDYYSIDDAKAVPGIIEKVTQQDATRFKGTPQIVQADILQGPLIVVSAAVIVLMIAAWRLRL